MAGLALKFCTPMLVASPEAVAVTSLMVVLLLVALTTPMLTLWLAVTRAVTWMSRGEAPMLEMAMTQSPTVAVPVLRTVRKRNSASLAPFTVAAPHSGYKADVLLVI